MFPLWPMIDEMLMMRPVPRLIMCSSAGLDKKKAPDRLTRSTLLQSSTDIFNTGRSWVMPALFTRMSRAPCCSMTSRMTRSQSAGSPTLP